MNGRGMPVTGSRAVTTIILIQACATIQVVIPAASSPENVSGALIAIR